LSFLKVDFQNFSTITEYEPHCLKDGKKSNMELSTKGPKV
jgi:hypothetical protein